MNVALTRFRGLRLLPALALLAGAALSSCTPAPEVSQGEQDANVAEDRPVWNEEPAVVGIATATEDSAALLRRAQGYEGKDVKNTAGKLEILPTVLSRLVSPGWGLDISYDALRVAASPGAAPSTEADTRARGQQLYDEVCQQAHELYANYRKRFQAAASEQKLTAYPLNKINLALLGSGQQICPTLWAAALLARVDACQENMPQSCTPPSNEASPQEAASCGDADDEDAPAAAPATRATLNPYKVELQALVLDNVPENLGACVQAPDPRKPALPVVRPVAVRSSTYLPIATRAVGVTSLEDVFAGVRVPLTEGTHQPPVLETKYEFRTVKRTGGALSPRDQKGVPDDETGFLDIWNLLTGVLQWPVPDHRSSEPRAYASATSLGETIPMSPGVVRRFLSSGKTATSIMEDHGRRNCNYSRWHTVSYKHGVVRNRRNDAFLLNERESGPSLAETLLKIEPLPIPVYVKANTAMTKSAQVKEQQNTATFTVGDLQTQRLFWGQQPSSDRSSGVSITPVEPNLWAHAMGYTPKVYEEGHNIYDKTWAGNMGKSRQEVSASICPSEVEKNFERLTFYSASTKSSINRTTNKMLGQMQTMMTRLITLAHTGDEKQRDLRITQALAIRQQIKAGTLDAIEPKITNIVTGTSIDGAAIIDTYYNGPFKQDYTVDGAQINLWTDPGVVAFFQASPVYQLEAWVDPNLYKEPGSSEAQSRVRTPVYDSLKSLPDAFALSNPGAKNEAKIATYPERRFAYLPRFRCNGDTLELWPPRPETVTANPISTP